MLHNVVQVFLVRANDFLNLFNRAGLGLPHAGDRFIQALAVELGLVADNLDSGALLELLIGADNQQLVNLGHGVAVLLEILGVAEEEVIALRHEGFLHFGRNLSRFGGHGRVHVHDAVHNGAHRKRQVINREQNDGNEDQPDNAQAGGHAPTERGPAREHSKRLSDSPSHRREFPSPGSRQHFKGLRTNLVGGILTQNGRRERNTFRPGRRLLARRLAFTPLAGTQRGSPLRRGERVGSSRARPSR